MNKIPVYLAALIFIVMLFVSTWSSNHPDVPGTPALTASSQALQPEAIPSSPVVEPSSEPQDPVEPRDAQGDKPDAVSAAADVTASPSAQSVKTSSAKPQSSTKASAQTPQVSRANSLKTDVNKYPKLSVSKGIYGQFRYRELSGGRIEIDPQWVEENIVYVKLPGVNRTVPVHRLAQDRFIQAFTTIANGTATVNGKKVSLLSLVRTFDGTWVPRHVNWNASKGLSNHSWGIAVDINASNHLRYVNPQTETNDPNLILWQKAFQPAGFKWGNSYSDSMHYKLY